MRILYLTNKPIYPLLDGGCVAMNQTAKLLMEDGLEVENITISTAKHPFNRDSFPDKFIHKFNPKGVFIDTKITFSGAFKSLFTGNSYHLSRFYTKDFAIDLERELKGEKYDLILCESLYLLPYIEVIRANSNAKIAVRTHNVEHLIWERIAESSGFLKRIILKKLAKQLKKEEIQLLQKADNILSISANDTAIFKELKINTPIFTVPVFVEEETVHVDYESNQFQHLGAMNWKPNLEAVHHLIHCVFPKIRTLMPHAELHLAGSYFPKDIRTNTEKGIFVHGFVEDKFEFINTHGIQLVNLKSGSGVRIKLLESLAMGVPIVSTKIGVEGLDLSCKDALLIAETEDDFVQKAVQLSKNKELRESIGASGIEFTKAHHSYSSIKKMFFEAINYSS